MQDLAIRVTDLSKCYRIHKVQSGPLPLPDAGMGGWQSRLRNISARVAGLARNGSGPTTQESSFWALRGISFDVARGEVVGLIGHNGAGKSTLLKILSRITEPTSGEALLHGRVGSLLEVGTGFHQELTGRENIYLSGAILGMRSDEINQAFDEIVDFAGVEEFLDMPVKRYSSGMKVRLGFAVAAHLRPEILLVDEVLAVGDAQFQKKCLAKMGDIVKGGRSILFVTHNMLAIQSLCERVIWLDSGAMVQDGPTDVVITQYLKSQGSGLMEQSWDDVESAPGNDKVRLHRACVRADIDPPPEVFTIRTPLRLEFEFWNLQPDAYLNPGFELLTEQGIVVFASAPIFEPIWFGRPLPVGLFRSTCYIPGDLLNSGYYQVRVRILENSTRTIYSQDVLSFDLHGSAERQRGWYGKTKGIVRPLLDWSTEYMGGELNGRHAEPVAHVAQ